MRSCIRSCNRSFCSSTLSKRFVIAVKRLDNSLFLSFKSSSRSLACTLICSCCAFRLSISSLALSSSFETLPNSLSTFALSFRNNCSFVSSCSIGANSASRFSLFASNLCNLSNNAQFLASSLLVCALINRASSCVSSICP